MSTPNPTPKRRGRPPGPPKEPKAPARMGRPTVWDARLGPSEARRIRAPKGFFEAFQDWEFRKKISDLMLEMGSEL